MRTSFLVIAFDAERTLGMTIESILRLEHLGCFEVVVVDDGSTDRTAEIVEAFPPPVRLIRHPENRGRGAARATGIAACSGTEIATIDADIVLPVSWLTACRAGLADDHAVSGIPIPDGDVQYVFNRFSLEPRPMASYTDVTGNNALYRREVFDQVAFDPDLRNGEDVALSHAMREAGFSTKVDHDVHVAHREAKDFRDSLHWLIESGVGATRQLVRYREIRTPDVVYGGWLASLGVSWLAARRWRSRLAGAALPVAYAMAASAAHLHGKFYLRDARPADMMGSIVTNAALLTAYFVGRTVGSIELAVKRPRD